MFDFCPHCGQAIEGEQIAGRMLVCARCGKDIGFAGGLQRAALDETEERIRVRTAARCPACQQAVDVKTTGAGTTLVPHYGAGTRRICPGSGKPAASQAPPPVKLKTPGGRDLSAYLTRDVIKIIFCTKAGAARIDVLTLEYLDKTDRVRIQIEALREMLGDAFRMRDYPPALNRTHLAGWVSADACVVAAKHERGGFQSIADADLLAVLADLRQHAAQFFA